MAANLGRHKRVLISTIAPISGGVPTMTRFVVDTLRGRGLEPVLGHYEPYSVTPALSVPSYRLFTRQPRTAQRTALDGCETYAIGAWLPELEFTHYAPTRLWRDLIHSCGAHLMVAGNVLAATHYARIGIPFVAWVATGWEEDRADRVERFPWHRRLLDRMLNGPILARLERQILRGGAILPLSRHTRSVLDKIAGSSVCGDVLPMPVDAGYFSPQPEAVEPLRIGFTGRFDDPRKNLELLLHALARLAGAGLHVKARLIGGEPTVGQRRLVERLNLQPHVEFMPYMDKAGLRDELRRFHIFVLPSHQEGLCISALEAMACGCPVVSTRCGGPEEFVIDDQTGYLTGFDADEMAAAIRRIVTDRELRGNLSEGARRMVREHYSRERAESVFWSAFYDRFPAYREARR